MPLASTQKYWGWYKGRNFNLTDIKVIYIIQNGVGCRWLELSGCFFFLHLTPSLIKLHPYRPYKRRGNVGEKSCTQLERKKLPSLKIDDDNSPNNMEIFCGAVWVDFCVSIWLPYGNILHIFGNWFTIFWGFEISFLNLDLVWNKMLIYVPLSIWCALDM